MKTIVTHGMNFHADDIFAVATVLMHLKSKGYSLKSKKESEKIRIIRTLQPEQYPDVEYILDIGGVYNAKKGRFDHHQQGGAGKRDNGVPYASFGLVWKTYGKELTGSASGADWIDRRMVQAIDGMDSGMYLYTPVIGDVHPFIFEDYFRNACDLVKGSFLESDSVKTEEDAKTKEKKRKAQSKAYDKEFMRMVAVAEDVLHGFIVKAKQKEAIDKLAKAAYKKAEDKRIIVSNHFIPTRFSDFKAPEYVEPLLFVFPSLREGWSAKTVPVNDQGYESKVYFPESWRGKRNEELEKVTGVPGSIFCHNAGFLAVAKTKEAVLELCRLALEK